MQEATQNCWEFKKIKTTKQRIKSDGTEQKNIVIYDKVSVDLKPFSLA